MVAQGGRCHLDATVAYQHGQWPTPQSWDGDRGPDYARREREGSGGDDLTTSVGGSLNPDWVETLMGYPIGYTLPEGEPLVLLHTRASCWPAGLGAPQHDWEPPRLTTEKQHRAARLKALGNSIVPQVARLWLHAIREES